MDDVERDCLEKLQIDVLAPFVPKIDRILCDKEDGNCIYLTRFLYIKTKKKSLNFFYLFLRLYRTSGFVIQLSKPVHNGYKNRYKDFYNRRQ